MFKANNLKIKDYKKTKLVSFLNFPIAIIQKSAKNNDTSRKICLFPKKEKNLNKPVFYLKFNSDTMYSYKCLQYWINIAEEMDADYYIVCDREILKEKIFKNITFKNIPQFMKSDFSRKNKQIISNISKNGLVNAGCAHLTTFFHASKNNYKEAWNIDADDTIMCTSKGRGCLINVANFAREKNLSIFSIDMHITKGIRKGFSLGVCYFNPSFDWNKIFNLKNIKKLQKGYFSFFPTNQRCIDSFLMYCSYAKNLFKGSSFYIENLYFIHWKSKVCDMFYTWKNNKLVYPLLKYFNHELSEIQIPDDIVKIDIGIEKEDSEEFILDKIIEANFLKRYIDNHTKEEICKNNFNQQDNYS